MSTTEQKNIEQKTYDEWQEAYDIITMLTVY